MGINKELRDGSYKTTSEVGRTTTLTSKWSEKGPTETVRGDSVRSEKVLIGTEGDNLSGM